MGIASQNIVLSTFKGIHRLLTPRQKRTGVFLILLTLLGVVLEVGRLALLIPVILLAMKPEAIHQKPVLRWGYDTFGFTSDDGYILALIFVVLAVFILGNAFTFWLNHYQSRYSYDVASDLSRRQHIRYFGKGLQFFRNMNSAEIQNEIRIIPSFFASGILVRMINLLSELGVIVLVVAGLMLYDISLLIALVLVLLPSAFLLYATTKSRLYRLGVRNNEYNHKTLGILNQTIKGYVDLKMFNKDAFFRNEYLKNQEVSNNTARQLMVMQLLPQRFIEIFAVLGVVVIFLYAVFWSNERQKLLEFLIAFAAAAFRVLPSLNRLLQALMSVKNHQFVMEKLLEEPLPMKQPDETYQPVTFQHGIEFRNVSYAYGDGRGYALRDVNLRVKKGEKIGIIGPSGSGKSTLMNLLLRFMHETQGQILVDGQPLTPAHDRGWRDLVGYVQQEVFLLDGTMRQNIAFGEADHEINEERLRTAIQRSSLGPLVDSLPQGLDTQVGEMGGKLSGGQRQRIGIARALYKQARLIVFDEATSALDMETEKEITEAIRQSADGEVTIFVIAHRLTTLKNCDCIVELTHGRISGLHGYDELIRARIG